MALSQQTSAQQIWVSRSQAVPPQDVLHVPLWHTSPAAQQPEAQGCSFPAQTVVQRAGVPQVWSLLQQTWELQQ